MLLPERSADIPLANSALFALPSMVPVRQAIDGEFDRYIARHGASLPKETIGVGEGFDFQLFDRALLYSADTRFVLAGIVNRMDRTYVAEASCGEIRLIYRLTRINKAAGDDAAPPRLPMTLNLVLKARGEGIHDHLLRNRQSLARGFARRNAVGKGWPARPDRLREYRPHRDQSPDRACAEIGGSRFPHRLSAEGVSLRRASARLRGSADGKPDRPRAPSGGRWPQARVQGMAARSRQSRRVRSRHGADPGKIPRQRRDRANAGRVSIHRNWSPNSD